jgi:hypothetical protein
VRKTIIGKRSKNASQVDNPWHNHCVVFLRIFPAKETGPMAKRNDLVLFPMRLSHEVERMFDEMIHRPWGFCRDIRGWNPSVDLYESPEAFILEADLPGG